MQRDNAPTNARVKAKLLELYDDVFTHDGYGQIQVDMRILRRGQKEVILRCGKEYRFVLDFPDPVLSRNGRTDVGPRSETAPAKM
mgnify:CR=1 FL=1